jgi:hypothetical protein
MKYDIITQNEAHVTSVLRGGDRLVFRGAIPMLNYLETKLPFLRHLGGLLKDYSEWALQVSEELKQACLDEAVSRGEHVTTGFMNRDLAANRLRTTNTGSDTHRATCNHSTT